MKKLLNGINTDQKCYLINPTFIKVNRLFALSFGKYDDINGTLSISECFIPKVEIKDFIAIDGKGLFLVCQ